MTKESEWVDYGMLLDEIHLHRSNAQRQINEYREKGKERDLTKSEYGLYNEEVGKEIALMCLERWCMDFKFSISEIKEMEVIQAEKNLPEGLEEEYDKYIISDHHLYEQLYGRGGLDIARHFAEWGMNQCPLPEDTTIFLKGVAEGKRLMLEEAVEHYVIGEIAGSPVGPVIVHYDEDLNIGDKVRVIVIKED